MKKLSLLLMIALLPTMAYTQESSSLMDLLDQVEEIVIVTASKYGQRIGEAPAAVSVITADDIAHYGWRDLADVLKAQPGFDVYSDRIYNFVTPRGFSLSNDPNSRILLLINGHSVVEFFGYYNGHLASIDLNHVKQIEIVRGPNSALYGTNAMFAVINVITKDGSTSDIRLIGEAGSFEHTKLSANYGRTFASGLKVFAQGTYSESDRQTLYFEAYDTPDHPSQSGGYSDPKTNERKLINGSFQFAYKNFSLHGLTNNRKKQVPTGIYGGRFGDKTTFFQDINTFIEAKYHWQINEKLAADLRAYTDLYKFKGRFWYYVDPDWVNGPPYPSEYNDIEDQALGGEVLFSTKWNVQHNTVFGGEYKRYNSLKFDYYSEDDPDQNLNERYDVDPEESIASLYLLHTFKPSQQLIFEAGLHYDKYSTVGSHISPRGSISYKPFANSWLKLLYGEAFRAPNFWESNDGASTIFYVQGNPDLKPEIVRNMELLFSTYPSQNIQWSNAFFSYELEDNIQQVEGQWQNVDGAVTGLGFETDVRLKYRHVLGYANLSYTRVESDLTDKRLPISAEWIAKAGFSKNGSWAALAVETQWIGPRLKALGDIENAGYNPELKAYSVTNVTVSNVKLTERIRFALSVYNIFDTEYAHPAFIPDLGSFYLNAAHPIYEIPADRRSFLLKTTVTF